MFARRAAAEVLVSDKNRCALIASFVEHERWIGLAVGQVAPVVKNKLAKARALDAFEKLLRDDLIRIDVRSVEWCYQTRVLSKGFHDLNSHALTSVKCPLIAAAAAIIGLTRCVRPPRP